MNCLLVLSLAVFGASASPCGLNILSQGSGSGLIGSGSVLVGGGSNLVGSGSVLVGSGSGLIGSGSGLIGSGSGLIGSGSGLIGGSAVQGRTLYGQTGVVENPTSVFPSVIPPASVSQTYHCLKTLVRPQIRNEIITVPTIDRVVRVVPTPVVEAVSVSTGVNTRNLQGPSFGGVSGSGVSGSLVDGVSGVVGGLSGDFGVVGGVSEGIVGGVSQGFLGGVSQGVIGGGVINSGSCGCGSNIIV